MKKGYALLLLVWITLATNAVHGQSLTLDQLIQLSVQDGITANSYLTNRGWVFDQHETLGDTAIETRWAYKTPTGKGFHYLQRQVKIGAETAIIYLTANFSVFESVRRQAVAARMELIEERALHSTVGGRYRGKNYDLWLMVSKQERDPNTPMYIISVQKHGLKKMLVSSANGEMQPVWMKASNSPPLKAELIDSVMSYAKRNNIKVYNLSEPKSMRKNANGAKVSADKKQNIQR